MAERAGRRGSRSVQSSPGNELTESVTRRLTTSRFRGSLPETPFSFAQEALLMTLLEMLWLPILLSAVIIFVASSIMHMALPYHRSDYGKLPDEDKVRDALRSAGLQRGLYIFPYSTHKEM